MVLKQVFGDLVLAERDLASGRAIGMSYPIRRAPNTPSLSAGFTFTAVARGGGVTFLIGLKPYKKSWEGSPGPTDFQAYMLMLLAQADVRVL